MATSGGQTLGVTISANMDPSGVLGAVKQMQGAFSSLKLPANFTGDILKDFNKLQESLKKFDSIAKQDHFSKTDLKNLEKLQKEIDSTFGSLKGSFDDLSGQKFYLEADYTKIKEAKAAVEDLKADIQSKLSEIKIDFSSAKGGTASLGLDELIAGMERGVKSSKVLSAAMGEVKQSLKAGDFGAAANQLSQIITKSNDLKGAGTGLLNIFKQWGLIDFSTPANELVKTKKGAELLATALSKIVPEISKDNEAVQTLVEKLQEAIKKKEGLEKTGTENLAKEMSTGAKSAEQLGSAFKTAGQSSREMAQGVSQAAEQVKQLQQSTQYFFSLRNMINLLKRGIREAVDVVKELDAAMTETAVVTDYSVSDMWQKLPEYTANANALGATVKDMYEATTLYYQQGLRTEAAMGIANETMKMARIGGLEAADATDKMTAALRGFNMEINEMSAQRVNDVYSNLAAKTASNTEELGTAMQRTASIAHSAGMSFEGTAAFLAQAIETTREPAENLGTAMKTIVARFTELKKNPLEITEVDGEEVSYNKVDTALQSIGVSLKDANGQFRDLDKVFLDISKRWDSLTQTQQRYIATTAAGSRQQSRFIAMMSNYERTMQLMDFANNSAGASTEQFGKTMESLEAKINKLRNAWNEFLMGIMNDKWTKRLVDAGTGILNLVNKIIDKLSFNGELGLVKSFLSIATAFTALKAGGNIINKLIGGLGGLVDPTSSFGKGFWGAGKTTTQGTPATGVAGKITTPIVAKLNELIAVTRQVNNLKNTNTQAVSTLGQYKNTSAMLRNTQSLGMGGIKTLFNGLSDEHAYAAYKNTPGTVDAIKKAALGWLGSQKMPTDAQKTGQQLMGAIFKGMSKKEIPIKDGMKLMGKPALWGEYFGTDVAKSFSQQYINQFKAQIPQMKQNTQTALQQTWQQLLGKNANNKAMQQGFLASQTGKDRFISAYKNNRASLGLDQESINNIPVIQNHFQQFANKVGILGSKFSAAGMSLQMFGAQLGQLSPALQGIGNLLTQVGMAVNTFGMGISGIGSVVTKIGGRFAAGQAAVKYGSVAMAQAVASGAVAAESTVAATGTSAASAFISGFTGGMSAGPIAAIIIGVLTGGIMIAKSIIDKKAKEAGEEVRENFEKGFTETNKKIDSLEGYKNRFNELSKGVDQFGHNISLTDEEYDEYLSISRDLQELSPSLIAGYNAEGQAILRKGEAIDEVIDKLKEERDLSLDSYISNDSVEKLIKAYNTSDAYKQHHTTIKDTASQNTVVSAFDSEKTGISNAIKKAGLEWSDFSQILDELGIGGAASISQLTNTQLGLISDHYIDILNKIKEFNPQIEQEAEEGLKEAFADTNNAIEDILTEGAPIVDALHQWMSQEKLDAIGLNLGEEFVSGFNSGIEGLMLEGLTNNWTPEEYKSQLKDYANEWKNLAGPTSQYANILSDADEIQQEYLDHIGEDGAIDNYKSNIESTAQKLEKLAAQYKDTGTAGEVFAEQCIEQANALRNYATEGVISLGEALNSLSDEFTAARGAQERFQEATKGGDYYTAAEGYKGILDTILDEKNTAGDGSLAFWAGADEILGKDFVDASSYSEVVNQLNKIKGCFEDGSDGVLAFNNLLVENKDKLEGLGHVAEDGGWVFDLQNEDLAEYAKALNMSEEALAGLIDKARQWVPIDLGDPAKIRQALEASEYSMRGTSTKGENLLYTSESEFRNEARRQGIRGDDYAQTKADAEAKGVRFLNVENLTAKNGEYANQVLDNIGLKGADKTLDNAVAALTKMGFNLEDQQAILTSKGIKLADGEASREQIEKSYNEQAYALENPTVAGIANDTGVIASAATAMLAKMGILTEQTKNDIEQSTSDETVKGYLDSLSRDGKGFEDSTARETARDNVQNQIDKYNETISLLEQSGNEALQPYIDKLINARDQLQQGLDTEAESWKTKLTEASELVKGIGTESEQAFLSEKAVDIQNIISQEDITEAASALRQLEEEGNLSHSTMAQLAADFLQLRQNDLSQMNSSQIDNLCTKLGLTKDEATELLDILQVPFSLEGRLSGEDLTAYINEVDGLTTTERTILLNADLSGEEKVSAFIDEIDAEFGDGTEKTKSIILQAEAKIAGGDQEGAEKLLTEAGFDENQVKEITQKLSITVNGTIANKGEVQEALNSELANMNLNANVKAKVSAKLDIKNQKANLKQQGTITYKSKVDQGAITRAKNAASQGANMPIKAVDKASSTIQSIRTKAGKSISFNVSPNFTGTWTKVLTIKTNKTNEEDARGRKFSIPAHHSLSFGSAAQGMNIPKRKKVSSGNITALVGEEGFEVGYIPSEQRSVIFGANGPEMTSFPKDTIIYPHDKSKEILRRGKSSHINTSSFGNGKDSVHSTQSLLAALGVKGSNGGSGNGSRNGSGNNNNKNNDKNNKDTSKEITRVIEKAGVVLVWWENVARRMDSAQRKAEKTQKTLDKLLKIFGTTADDYNKAGQIYKQQLQKVQDIAKEKIQEANAELNYTVNGKSSGKTATEVKEQEAAKAELDAAKKKLEKAKKTKKNKKDDKKAQKKVDAAQKAYNATAGAKKDAAVNEELESIGARQEISYNVTKKTTKKNKKGKKKTTTKEETKKETINLSNYIKYEDGVAIIDQAQIDAIAKTNKSKAEAIKQAAEKQINDLNSKLKAAEDELAKAQEEYEQFLNDTYDAFYAWDKSITEVYFLGKELEKLGELRSMYEAATDVEFAKLLSGVNYDKASNGLKNVLDALPGLGEALEKNRDYLMQQAQTNYAKMNAAYTEYINAITGADNLEKYRKAMGSDIGLSQNAKNEYEIWKATQEFLKDSGFVGSNFDISAAIDKFNRGRLGLEAKNWKGDDYEKIKQGLDKIAEKQTDYYNAIIETYSSITEIYGVIEEYQSYLSDFENSLIKGIEEQSKQEIDRLNKLDSSINNAIKDLLDEVKRKLDERRKQEDNKKTERDISQKQQRLAALQADTSGGHQVEIAQLQKEIAESKQNYERTLEDQLLDRLSQQQDLAAQQRQHQIELLETQNTLAAQLGTNVEEVNKWLANPDQYFNDIRAAWLVQQGYEEAGAAERKQLEEQFVSEFAKFEAYGLALPGLMEAATSDIFSSVVETELPKSVSGIEQRLDSILGIIPTVEELANLPQLNVTPGSVNPSKLREAGYTIKEAIDYSTIQRGQAFSLGELYKGGYTTPELYKAGFTNAADYKAGGVSYTDAKSAGFSNEALHKAGYQEGTAGWAQELDAFIQKSNEELASLQGDLRLANTQLHNNQDWLASAKINLADAKATYEAQKKKAEEAAKKAKTKSKGSTAIATFVGSPSTLGITLAQSTVDMYQDSVNKYAAKVDSLQKKIEQAQNAITTATNKRAGLQFKTGGIADYTGPAWLDGTPSKPELVLNPQDTQNFLALRDVLSKAIGSTNSIDNTYGGDNIFEINVNVDKIEKDYDVDRVIEKVKKEIAKGAGYRNVTQVRNFR